jgi:DNA-binding transcriptional ArsR family regulator
MNTLAEILSSRVKAEIFCLLFGHAERELHLRELERRSGSSVSAVRQELKRLVRLGLVEARKDGNRTYYRASRIHPLFADLRNLVLKTSGLVEVLRDALKALKIRAAFVFGSLASGAERAHSDVDLLVIGDAGFREVCDALADVTQTLGRDVNTVAFSPDEFVRRKKDDDHFLTTVLSAPKLFVIGDDNELEGLARQRVAPAASNVAARNPRPVKNRGARSA